MDIRFKVNPDPPRSGDNEVEVILQSADGAPITDATVSTMFYMPAMPSMNMPEMSNGFTMSHVEGGLYKGKGSLEMAGTWDVTVRVSRDGKQLGIGRRTVIAK